MGVDVAGLAAVTGEVAASIGEAVGPEVVDDLDLAAGPAVAFGGAHAASLGTSQSCNNQPAS